MPKMSHIEITRLQGGLAIASFVSGVVIARPPCRRVISMWDIFGITTL